jgi:hypothetical protein
MTEILITPQNIEGFDEREFGNFQKLLNIFNLHYAKNIEKQKYYEGRVPLSDVNLGIALPH